ncbi:MAG: hypothetical protein K6C97_08065 [Treponema sp.]|nr:hypothetical protein [Treponema sp.]
MKKLLAFLSIFMIGSAFMFAQMDQGLPKGTVELFDGFENGNYWIWAGFDWDQYGDIKISTGANLSRDWASEGKHSLELTMDALTEESGKSGVWFYDGTNDLSGSKYIAIDIYNPEDYTYSIQAVLQATDSWNWCGLPGYQVTPGVHTLVWDLSQYDDKLFDVRRISVYSSGWEVMDRESHIYVDNIRLIK